LLSFGANSTFFGPIFGKAPFKGRKVYQFGVPSDFRSFSSSFADFSLIGVEYNADGFVKISPVPLVEIPNEDAWYSIVVKANVIKNAYFLRPGKQYSPISNVLSPPSKGILYSLRGEEYVLSDTGAADQIEEDESDEDEHYDPDPDEGIPPTDEGSAGFVVPTTTVAGAVLSTLQEMPGEDSSTSSTSSTSSASSANTVDPRDRRKVRFAVSDIVIGEEVFSPIDPADF